MKRMSFLFALLLFFSEGCATATTINTSQSYEGVVRGVFTEEIASELLHVHVNLHKTIWVPFVGSVLGYYNPITDTVNMTEGNLSVTLTVHEFLHRVWFQNMTFDERRAFVRDLMDLAAANPDYKTWVTVHLEQRCWLNRMCAGNTELFSDCGEAIIQNADLPESVMQHFRKWLIIPTKEEPPPQQ